MASQTEDIPSSILLDEESVAVHKPDYAFAVKAFQASTVFHAQMCPES
jgi:hypothetical protein